jgi:RimJ/RimL family protein N-acetyltransferase
MSDNIVIRSIEHNDYIEYLNLMREFHGYNYEISYDNFCNQLQIMVDNDFCNIFVIYSNKERKLIGAGSIYKLVKLHNNSVGQIEDIIITEKYRGYGYGKMLIEKLCHTGLDKFNCYKIILNCLEKNIRFYEKCEFIVAGVEMKLNKN